VAGAIFVASRVFCCTPLAGLICAGGGVFAADLFCWEHKKVAHFFLSFTRAALFQQGSNAPLKQMDAPKQR
jgi:hypothetical protein